MRIFRGSTVLTFMASDGIRITYEVSKGTQKQTLFFVHGMGGELVAWDRIRRYLSDLGYPTIAYDLRGHGKSDRPLNEKQYKIERFAQDIKELLMREKLSDVILVGHCFGGMVAMVFAANFPKQVSRLVLLNTSYKTAWFAKFLTKRNIFKKAHLFLANISPAAHLPYYVDYTKITYAKDYVFWGTFVCWAHTSLKSYFFTSKTINDFSGKKYFSDLTMPTCIIAGGKDTVFPAKISEEMHKLLPNSLLTIMPKSNHPVVINDPIGVAKIIKKFID